MNAEKYIQLLEDGELFIYIENLQQENQSLKDKITELEKVITTNNFGLVAPTIKEYEVQILKGRIEKAIEYIEKYTREIEGITGYYYTISDTEELLEILKGDK